MITATMSTPKKTPITIPAMAPLLSILAAAVAMADTVLGGGGAAHGRNYSFKVMLWPTKNEHYKKAPIMLSAMLPLLGMLAAAVALADPVLQSRGAAHSID